MKVHLFILIILVVFISCKDDTTPITVDPPNPFAQKEIAWPSLQKAPWPMYRHDPQLTGRSPYVGPSKGIIADTLRFRSSSNDSFFVNYFSSGVAIDMDHTMHIVYTFDAANYISYGLTDRTERWRATLTNVTVDNPNIPTVLSNNTMVVTSGGIYSITDKGKVTWELPYVRQEMAQYNSAVDRNGNIYFINKGTGTLHCVSPTGDIQWTATNPYFIGSFPSMTFSPDGKTLYIPSNQGASMLAFDITSQNVRWTFTGARLASSIMVDNQNNIYFQKGSSSTDKDTFFCVRSDGTVRWRYIFLKDPASGYQNFDQNPTIDDDGNIYLFAPRDTLVSLTNDGIIRWKYPLHAYNGGVGELVCDASGTVFFVTNDNHLMAVSRGGTMLWNIKFNASWEWYSSPALMEGKLVLTANSGNIYVIE